MLRCFLCAGLLKKMWEVRRAALYRKAGRSYNYFYARCSELRNNCLQWNRLFCQFGWTENLVFFFKWSLHYIVCPQLSKVLESILWNNDVVLWAPELGHVALLWLRGAFALSLRIDFWVPPFTHWITKANVMEGSFSNEYSAGQG